MDVTCSSALPPEILNVIFTLDLSQATLRTCTLVSQSWYKSSIAHLYAYPLITGANFDLFVASVCPSVNAHIRRNGLADLVKVLDMSGLVHNGRKSLTARLLGRLKNNLETFIGPQATFAVNSLAALSKCTRLKILNLSLVSQAIPHTDLFQTLTSLTSLQDLHMPRAYTPGPKQSSLQCSFPLDANTIAISNPEVRFFAYPPQLTSLYIRGGLDDLALLRLSYPPQTLTHLTIQDSLHLTSSSIHAILSSTSQHLRSLRLGPTMPRIERRPSHFQLKSVPGVIWPLHGMPALEDLSICYEIRCCDYLFPDPYDERSTHDIKVNDENKKIAFPALRRLEIMASAAAYPYAFGPLHVWTAIEANIFPKLRVVRCHRRLGWQSDTIKQWDDKPWMEVRNLDEYLKTLAHEDSEEGRDGIQEDEAGVIFFGKS